MILSTPLQTNERNEEMNAINWNEVIASPDFDVYENARRVINEQMSVDEFCDTYIDDEDDADRVFQIQLLITKLDTNSDLQEIIENAIKRRGHLTGNCCENCYEGTDMDEWIDYLGQGVLYCRDCYDRMMDRKNEEEKKKKIQIV